MIVLWYTEKPGCVWVMTVRLFCKNDSRRRTQSAVRETYSWSVHFYPPPSRLAFVQMCLHSLLLFLFDVMLVVFAPSVTCPLDLVRGSSDFIVLLPTCNSNKTSGGRVKQSCNKLYFSCIVVLIALQIIHVTFIMYLPFLFLFVFFSPKLFIATIYVV